MKRFFLHSSIHGKKIQGSGRMAPLVLSLGTSYRWTACFTPRTLHNRRKCLRYNWTRGQVDTRASLCPLVVVGGGAEKSFWSAGNPTTNLQTQSRTQNAFCGDQAISGFSLIFLIYKKKNYTLLGVHSSFLLSQYIACCFLLNRACDDFHCCIVNVALVISLTHCGRVTQICVFSTVKLGTSASSLQCHSTRGNVSRGITRSSTTRVFGEYFLKISVHKNSQRICYKFLKKHSIKVD